jgi:uncharacterized protein YigA (DUF484 family)
MTKTEPTISEMTMEELRTKSSSLEQQMSKLMKLMDGNSTYRDEIIWLAREINQIQERIKKLESLTNKATA